MHMLLALDVMGPSFLWGGGYRGRGPCCSRTGGLCWKLTASFLVPHEPLAPLWVTQLAEPITVTVTVNETGLMWPCTTMHTKHCMDGVHQPCMAGQVA